MSKQHQLRVLLSQNGCGSTCDRDELYRRKISKEIGQLERFIAQADAAIANLQTYQPKDAKTWVLALHEVYLKVPYVSSKDEVIGSAVADVNLRKLNETHKAQLKWLDESVPSVSVDSMISDINTIISELDTAIAVNEAKLSVLTQKTADSDASNHHDSLDRLLSEANDGSKQMKSNLQRVVTKFIALQIQSLDKESLKFPLKSMTKMLLQLLKSQDWVQVVPDEYNVLLIKVLIYNSIVTRRDDSSVNGYYLKMVLFD
jgi:uncharacterized coiled-coil protein SlyX